MVDGFEFIKKLLREGLLTEALPDIYGDVDLIYDKYFREDISTIEAFGRVSGDMFKRTSSDTSILKSDICVKAHELNPCEISINKVGNSYSPINKVINISVNTGALGFVMKYDGNLDYASDMVEDDKRNKLLNEFTESKFKGSIHHELLHWVDDTLNNRHINKKLDKASEVGRDKYFKGKDVNMSKFEIQAQMGNIMQLKKRLGDNWDYITFKNMIDLSPPLVVIYDRLNGDDRDKWVRQLKTRMYREGLLGSKMFNT
jgi:hypothetical protein